MEKLKNHMDKFKSLFRSIFPVLFVLALAGFFVVGVYAASTIGTNVVTTGTMHVGGDVAQTKFEVQGTASASYFLTGNTIQVGGYASVAYNRFGTSATTEAHYIAAANDVLIGGDLEVRGTVSFGGVASIANALWVGTNTMAGNVGVGTSSPTTKFQVTGNASVSSNFEVVGIASLSNRFVVNPSGASVSSNFEVSGIASASTLVSKTSLLAGSGRTASSSTAYVAEFGTLDTGSVGLLFGGNSASKGTCLQLKDTAGNWVYARINAGQTSFTINSVQCHD